VKELLEFIVTRLVDNPKQVEIHEKIEDDLYVYDIKVAPEDMGKIIGKEGKIIKSVRTLLKIPAIKNHKKISLNLIED
jgi:predicted RNA-binding protein YlqC (UPF0109 family)